MNAGRWVAAAFVVSMLASVGLVAVYAFGGDTQLEGLLLGFALGGLGTGIALWATDLLDEPDQVEEREPLATLGQESFGSALGGKELTRRSLLVRLGGGAAAALAGTLAIPALSLGPRPGTDLLRTRWTSGARVVGEDGEPLRPIDVQPESVATVYPQGSVGSADSQALLIRVDPSRLSLPDGRGDWAPEGCLVYSKICTHAGCPVGLYRAQAHQLLCPCHQSTFDVLTGAPPVFGPAARPLPQLPLDVDDDGYLVASGDFSEPVGPSFWNITSRDTP